MFGLIAASLLSSVSAQSAYTGTQAAQSSGYNYTIYSDNVPFVFNCPIGYGLATSYTLINVSASAQYVWDTYWSKYDSLAWNDNVILNANPGSVDLTKNGTNAGTWDLALRNYNFTSHDKGNTVFTSEMIADYFPPAYVPAQYIEADRGYGVISTFDPINNPALGFSDTIISFYSKVQKSISVCGNTLVTQPFSHITWNTTYCATDVYAAHTWIVNEQIRGMEVIIQDTKTNGQYNTPCGGDLNRIVDGMKVYVPPGEGPSAPPKTTSSAKASSSTKAASSSVKAASSTVKVSSAASTVKASSTASSTVKASSTVAFTGAASTVTGMSFMAFAGVVVAALF